MICIGMGIDNPFYFPVLCSSNLDDFLGRFFIVSAIDQINIRIVLPIDTDLCR